MSGGSDALSSLQEKIKTVEKEIEDTKVEIEGIKLKLGKEGNSDEEKTRLQDQLLEEKRNLNHLREEKLILLRAASAPGVSPIALLPRVTRISVGVAIPDSLLPENKAGTVQCSTAVAKHHDFLDDVIKTQPWNFQVDCDVLPRGASSNFTSYLTQLLPLKAKDVHGQVIYTHYLAVQGTNGCTTFSARTDRVIYLPDRRSSSDPSDCSDWDENTTKCLVELQAASRPEHEVRKHLLLQLLIYANTCGLKTLLAMYILDGSVCGSDAGKCKLFRAVRNQAGGVILEEDGHFFIHHLPAVLHREELGCLVENSRI